ncbi:MAG: ribonuclease P protein component [Microbacteriaceae bacterium]|nr:ribonuclease P protein component [Microbacteriaceae bacterium]
MLPREFSLRTSQDFRRVFKTGKRRAGSFLQITFIPEKAFRMGVVVTKAFGSAPKRNQFRRRVKAIVREWLQADPKPIHLVVRSRAGSEKASYQELNTELLSLLEGIK